MKEADHTAGAAFALSPGEGGDPLRTSGGFVLRSAYELDATCGMTAVAINKREEG